MAEASSDLKPKSGILGWVVFASVAWLLVCAVLFAVAKPCQNEASEFLTRQLSCLSANEMGDFLAGAFAPLAFLWLIAAVFLQREELTAQRTELSLTRREFELTRSEVAAQRVALEAQALQATRSVEFIERQTSILSEQHDAEETKQVDADVENMLAIVHSVIHSAKIKIVFAAGTTNTLFHMNFTGNYYSDLERARIKLEKLANIVREDATSVVTIGDDFGQAIMLCEKIPGFRMRMSANRRTLLDSINIDRLGKALHSISTWDIRF